MTAPWARELPPVVAGSAESGKTGTGPSPRDRTGELPLVAVILPPREGFGPGRSGALGLLARRYATAPGFRTLVIGGEQDGPPFADVPFAPARPVIWWPGNINQRYVAGMRGILRDTRPALIEVHNRPE